MTKASVNNLAFAATVFVCVIVDGIYVALWIALASDMGMGFFIFLFAIGPLTLYLASPIYSWFNKRLLTGSVF